LSVALIVSQPLQVVSYVILFAACSLAVARTPDNEWDLAPAR
jgi:hypothetical protein